MPHPEYLVASPLSGTIVPLSRVPDEVFAGYLVGAGLAIEPEQNETDDFVTVYAPATGRIGSLFPHAFALEIDAGHTVLVHLGIDTVKLKGEGFTTLVEVGDDVEVGQPIAQWNPRAIIDAGYSTLTPVIALQAPRDLVELHAEPGDSVAHNQHLLTWR